jgi:excisionase family DNA binding protein
MTTFTSEMMNPEQVASLLAIRKDTVYRWNRSGMMPEAIKIGKILRWQRNDVEEWIADGCPRRIEVEEGPA